MDLQGPALQGMPRSCSRSWMQEWLSGGMTRHAAILLVEFWVEPLTSVGYEVGLDSAV